MTIFMQKNSKQPEYIQNYRHNLGVDDFALQPCNTVSVCTVCNALGLF